MAAPEKYAHIDFTPPAGARREAEQGLKLRREHGRGGTAVGIARARDIANGVKLSPSTVRRMKAFFDRHASDSKAEGFRRGEKGWPSNGVIANKLWGGPAGYSWAKKVVAQMEAADARSTYSLDAETSTIEAGTDRRSAVIPNVERRFIGNFSETEEANPDLLKVEERADPETGKKRTYLVGYAARFGKNSLLLGDFVERIAPSAFDIVEKRKDAEGKPLETRCLFNHSPDNLLGRFPTTMRMWVDDVGLRYECLLPETRKDIAELVARGDLKGSSFSFVVAEGGEKWSTEEGRSLRLVTKIKSLLDCGPVTYPAYDSATVAVAKRSYDQFVATKKPEPVVEKRDSSIAARVAEEARKTEEFLAERRGFCPTGPGGGIDNSCGKAVAGEKTSGKAKAKKKESNDDETDPNEPTIAGTATLGAAIGAGIGSAAGVAGAGVGALAGAAVGAATGAAGKVAYKVKTAINKKISKVQQGKSKEKVDPNEPTVLGRVAAGAGIGAAVGATGGLAGAAAGAVAGAGIGAVVGAVDKVGYKVNTKVNKTISKAQKAIGEKVFGKKKRSLSEFMSETESFLAERRGFCATGAGGGIDNSCGGKELSAPDSGGGSGGGMVAPKPGTNPSGGQKSLEQQRLEAAGKWDKDLSHKENIAINTPYDGGDNGGFVPDYHRDVTIPGTNQKTRINVDDQEHVSQFIGLAAKAAGMTPADYMKSRRMNGTPQKASPEDKAKLFGGTPKQYVSKVKRSGGWGNKELDDAAKRLGSTLRAAGIKGETLSHAVREHAKATGRDPKDEMYSGLKTYQRDPGEFMVWAKKRLDHYFANSKRSLEEFLAERRGFCPTGEGGGIDNSCPSGKGNGGGEKGGDSKKATPKDSGPTGGKSPMLGKMLDKIDKLAKDAKTPGGTSTDGKSSVLGKMIDRIAKGEKGSGGSQSPKSGSGEKYKKPDDEDTDWLGRKTGKGPNWLGNDVQKTIEKVVASGGKADGPSAETKGDYKEWSKGDHKDSEKVKKAQDFLDKARADQLARGGKDGGKSDDGGGVQTWSKGDHFPWTTKQVGTDEGHVQGIHPDGSKTAKYPFKGDSSEAHRKVYEEIKSKKRDKRSVTLAEMKSFFMERAG